MSQVLWSAAAVRRSAPLCGRPRTNDNYQEARRVVFQEAHIAHSPAEELASLSHSDAPPCRRRLPAYLFPFRCPALSGTAALAYARAAGRLRQHTLGLTSGARYSLSPRQRGVQMVPARGVSRLLAASQRRRLMSGSHDVQRLHVAVVGGSPSTRHGGRAVSRWNSSSSSSSSQGRVGLGRDWGLGGGGLQSAYQYCALPLSL